MKRLKIISFLVVCSFVMFAQGQTVSAKRIVSLMHPGWNLGNTLEAGIREHNYSMQGSITAETGWQPTQTTFELIDYVKSLGFRSVRIPCAWVMGHVNDTVTLTIDPVWLERVHEVVDYCISDSLYVLLNDHWDGGWMEKSFDDLSEATVEDNCRRMRLLWTQIAESFRDYDEHLLFGGLNEPDVNSKEACQVLQRYEQAFIDAVRDTGGRNVNRILVVQGPGTDIDKTCRWFDVSCLHDTTPDALIIEVHYYAPFGFTHCYFDGDNGENAAKQGDWNWPLYFWGEGNHVSGSCHNATWGEEEYLIKQFHRMREQFVDRGYPVIIGEYGTNWRKMENHQAEHGASVKRFFRLVNEVAVKNDMATFAWDINDCDRHGLAGTMTIIDRSNLSVFCTPAMEGIQKK